MESMYVRYRQRLLRKVMCPFTLIITSLLIIGWRAVGPDTVITNMVGYKGPRNPHQFQTRFDRSITEMHERIAYEVDCPIPSLTHVITARRPVQQAQCQRVKPLKGSCSVARKLFLSQPPADCKHQAHHRICTLKKTDSIQYSVHCNEELCDQKDGIHLGLTNSSTGALDWQMFQSINLLRTKISKIVNGKLKLKTYGFCFIKCQPNRSRENSSKEILYDDVLDLEDYQQDDRITQLLLLPNNVNPDTKDRRNDQVLGSDGNEKISINIIWVDSVSRHHFFRSMPKSLAMIETINSATTSKAKVLDYKLFQAIKSRTYESFQAMIAGEVDLTHEPFGLHSMPPEPLRIENLLGPLKKSGYVTQWLEDLCWYWEWGLPKDLLSYNPDMPKVQLWARYHRALRRAGVDDVGITIASCHLLEYYRQNDPFYGPDAMCYNALHQHDYLLRYLQMQQRGHRINTRPYFSVLVSCVGHEPTGRRLQTLDESLAKYLSFVSTEPNAVTFIMSDHGNSYGALLEKSPEGSVELFQPFLFIVVPLELLRKLDPSEMQALFVNQDRLISMIDLHQTIKYLTKVKVSGKNDFIRSAAAKNYDIAERGLLQEISANRTCSSLPLIAPNLCLCQGYEQSVQNDSYYALFADFALGQLNNEILRQFRVSHPRMLSGFGNCRRLVATEFRNVRVIINSDDSAVVKLDLYVPNHESGAMEVFLSVLQVDPKQRLAFVSFERISKYGIYRACADSGVEFKLCVCSASHPDQISHRVNPPSVKFLHEPVVQIKTTLRRIEMEGEEKNICAFILQRKNKKGASFHAANMCLNKVYKVSFRLQATDIVASIDKWPVFVVLFPGDIKHLFTGITVSSNFPLVMDWEYSIQYSYEYV